MTPRELFKEELGAKYFWYLLKQRNSPFPIRVIIDYDEFVSKWLKEKRRQENDQITSQEERELRDTLNRKLAQ